MIGIYDLNTCSNLDYKERVDTYKKVGFQEIALYLDQDYQSNNENYIDIIKYAREIGLKISQVHIDWKISNLICDNTTSQYFDYILGKLNEAKALDIPFVIAHASQSNTPPKVSTEQLEKFKNVINQFKAGCKASKNFLKILVITTNNPWQTPQNTKFQLAPCHNPLKNHTANTLRSHLKNDTLLPPNGI